MRVEASIWLYELEDKKTVKEYIENHDDTESSLFNLGRPSDVYVEDDALVVTGQLTDELFFTFDMPFTGSELHRSIVTDLIRLTGMHRIYKADDRGRITIGQQYANQNVEVVVISQPGNGDADE